MHNTNIVLIKALLLSTSQINILKHSTDKKKKGRVKGNLISYVILVIITIALCVSQCIGLNMLNLNHVIPVGCAISLSALGFIMTVFRSNGYLFNYKEYDMLMALPIGETDIAKSRFIFMYLKMAPWFMCISAGFLLGYALNVHPSFIVYLLWILLSALMPVIPMLAASFLGYLIAKIGSGFVKKNLIQSMLSIIIIVLSFGFRFFAQLFMESVPLQQLLETLSNALDTAQSWYLPAAWFGDAINKLEISSILLLVGITLVLFELVFMIVGRSYRTINSALKSSASSGHYKMTQQRKMSVIHTIAFKEYKRMTGSTTYMTNVGSGPILCLILGLVVLVLGFDNIVSSMFQDSSLPKEMFYPAIPILVYFLIGMMPTTVCSPSLEGKQYWIVQSLPIRKTDLYKGKMLFNMYLTVPCSVFTTLCFCFSAGIPFVESVLYVLLGVVLCALSTAWGCVIGIKFMRLDWENEVEVIKQGTAVFVYLMPNMLLGMIFIFGAVILGQMMNHNLLACVEFAIALVLSILSYLAALSLAKKQE